MKKKLMIQKRMAHVIPVLFVVVVLIFSVLTPPTIAHAAATFTVNSTADTMDAVPGNGVCFTAGAVCTLRAAIQEANAWAGNDTITFAGNYTITLGSQLPVVTTTIIINGNGAANTIVQASTCNPVTLPGGCTPAAYRVFEVTNTGNLTLDGLTVRNGVSDFGGGINNMGFLTVSNVTFSANDATTSGGGMYTYGTTSNPSLTNVTFNANSATLGGGGMYNRNGSPTLKNVTFNGNDATDYGGGMYNYESVASLTNVTFSGNSATSGGGMYIDRKYEGSSPTLTNVTFSANSADYKGGGMYNDDSSPTLTNVTFSANFAYIGGGLYTYRITSNPMLTNVIIADSSSGGDCINSSSTVNAQNSLIEDGLTCVNGTNINNLTGDPMLNPTLADNGGSTQTHALLAGSPAIDAGTNTGCPVTDQRGVNRDSSCDIGAYEYVVYQLFLPLIRR